MVPCQRIDRAQRRRGTLGAATQLRLAVLHLLSLLTTLALAVLAATAAGLGQFSAWPTPLTPWDTVCGRQTDRAGGAAEGVFHQVAPAHKVHPPA